jgi:hypothetical protein
MLTKNALPLLVAAVFAVAGCGGGAKDPGVASLGNTAKNSPPASPSASLDPKDAALKYAQCMRQNGIDVPDPKAGGGLTLQADGKNQAKLEKAMKACEHLMQDSGIGKAAKDPKFHDALVKYAACMRAHGVDMPDPNPDGSFQVKSGDKGKGKGKTSIGIGGNDAASKACKNLLPNVGGADGGSSTNSQK